MAKGIRKLPSPKKAVTEEFLPISRNKQLQEKVIKSITIVTELVDLLATGGQPKVKMSPLGYIYHAQKSMDISLITLDTSDKLTEALETLLDGMAITKGVEIKPVYSSVTGKVHWEVTMDGKSRVLSTHFLFRLTRMNADMKQIIRHLVSDGYMKQMRTRYASWQFIENKGQLKTIKAIPTLMADPEEDQAKLPQGGFMSWVRLGLFILVADVVNILE